MLLKIFNIKILLGLQVIIISSLLCSCRKFLETPPPKQEISTETAFASDEAAQSAMRGIYSEIMANNNSGFSGGVSGIAMLSGLSSDEFKAVTLVSDYYTNSLLATTSSVKSALWDLGYKYIYYCNSVLDGLDKSESVSQNLRNQLIGEAKFLRAYFHFYLVNLFGDVPIVTTTDYHVNSTIGRSSISAVYQQIIEDLIEGSSLLPTDFSSYSNQRIRATKWAAKALLARVYLYQNEWAKAENFASEVISNSQFAITVNLDNVFLGNSTEAILQFLPVNPNVNTWDGSQFIPSSFTVAPKQAISDQLLASFETNDQRKNKWLNSFTQGGNTYYYPYKYKVRSSTTVTEYFMVLRIAEQILIRAEARANLGNLSQAIADVDLLRNRAGLPLIQNTNPGISKDNLLILIANERRVELYGEWGHRWFDLKRTNRVNQVLQLVKGGNWQSTDALYPIPQAEIDRNPNLVQNPGY